MNERRANKRREKIEGLAWERDSGKSRAALGICHCYSLTNRHERKRHTRAGEEKGKKSRGRSERMRLNNDRERRK